jgi:hypothetical protein
MNSKIENWKIREKVTGGYGLIGYLYDDDRSPDGTIVITSKLKWINFDDKVAQTKNTLYKLGKPLEEDK